MLEGMPGGDGLRERAVSQAGPDFRTARQAGITSGPSAFTSAAAWIARRRKPEAAETRTTDEKRLFDSGGKIGVVALSGVFRGTRLGVALVGHEQELCPAR